MRCTRHLPIEQQQLVTFGYRALLSLVGAAVGGCAGPDVLYTPNHNCVTSVVAGPTSQTVEPGEVATFTATISEVCVGLTPAWSSSDASIAQVLTVAGQPPTQAQVKGLTSGGPIQVSVRMGLVGHGEKADTVLLTVRQPIASSVAITPNPVSLTAGGPPITLTATVTNAFGVVMSAPSIAWTSSNLAVATVTPTGGTVSSVGPGTTTITARETATNRSGTAIITVSNLCTVLSEDFTLGNPFVSSVPSQSGGAVETTPQTVSPGGNPGVYLRMAHAMQSPSTIVVDHMFPTTYSPGVIGAIVSIDYREDRIQFAPPFVGAAIGAGFVMKQGAARYAVPLSGGTFTSESWQRAERVSMRIADFPGADFSTSGAPLQFGFYRSNSSDAGGSAYVTTHGIDNWEVKVCR
ncbi:MAG: hypothetical protein ABMA00_16780 [Gemmatimonas sp.]